MILQQNDQRPCVHSFAFYFIYHNHIINAEDIGYILRNILKTQGMILRKKKKNAPTQTKQIAKTKTIRLVASVHRIFHFITFIISYITLTH